MGNRLIRHNSFFKVLTIAGASLGVISSSTFAVFMGIDAVNGNLITDNLREYTASFYSEGALISEATYKRGEEIEIPEVPPHEMDGESMYIPLGWDILGNGVPDFIPPRIYSNIKANAVYFKTGKFDLSFLDLTNMDLETLLELMDKLNIDWEQFMDMFNIDPETLMKWLQQQSVLTFTTNSDGYLTYFRSTSFGDYNYAKKSYNAPDFYDVSKISEGSINPLSYTADKVNSAYSMSDQLPTTFAFSDYDIKFNSKQDYYPVPDCEHADSASEIVNSDAHYITQPVNNSYSTYAAYVPAMKNIIDILSFVPFSNTNIMRDERQYYRYALEKYTTIPTEYEGIIDKIIADHKWLEGDYGKIDNIGAFVESLGSWNIFNDDGSINISPDKNKDPVNGLIDNKTGSDLDFNTVALMICRRLSIPARIVKGYWWSPMMAGFMELDSGDGTHNLTMLNQRYWCEIYVKNIGWMIFDTVNVANILGTNPYGELDKESNPFENNHELLKIEVTPPSKTEYFIGERLELNDLEIEATFTDETTEILTYYDQGVRVFGYDPEQEGEQTITVSYTYEDKTETDTFKVTVKKKPAELEYVWFDLDEVTGDPNKLKYFIEDQDGPQPVPDVEFDGAKAYAHYDDNTDVEIDFSLIKLTDDTFYDLRTEGTYTIYLDVKGETYENVERRYNFFEIQVVRDIYYEISVLVPPAKTTYYTGEKFDPTGLILLGLCERGNSKQIDVNDIKHAGLVSYSGTNKDGYPYDVKSGEFDRADDNFEITIEYRNIDNAHTVVSTTLVVEVKQNIIDTDEEITFDGFIDEYTLGDVFDPESFKANGEITATLANGEEITFDADDITVGEPSLSELGDSTVQIKVKYGDDEYPLEVPIEIKNVDSDDFAISSKVSTAGPGEGNINDSVIFTYTIKDGEDDYVGTMYFRNASYANYDPKNGWSNDNLTNYNVSPSSFTYEKASIVHKSLKVTIDYQKDVLHGVAPVYSNVTGFDEFLINGSKVKDTSETFTATNFALTSNNVRRLQSLSYASSTQTVYNTYRSSVTSSNSDYLKYDTSDASDLISEYISTHGYKTYNVDDVEQRINVVNAVKAGLQSEFVYDASFKYPNASQDPIVSFLEEGRGICNNFAATATMIYRQLGIPARFVTGFGSYCSGGTTSVSPQRAHAWTEVWFDNIGWVIVDATGYEEGGRMELDYGSGFGGGGIFNVPMAIYGGDIELTYDYDSIYDYDSVYVGGWYKVFDDQDNHMNVVSWQCKVSDAVVSLPEFLELQLIFKKDGVVFENDPDNHEQVDVGYYSLTPEIRIIDKTTDEDVTDQYEFALKADTPNLEYTILPATIVVEVNSKVGTEFSLEEQQDGKVSFNNDSVVITTNLSEDNPFVDLPPDALPSTIAIEVASGYTVEFNTPGTYLLIWEDGEGNPIDPYYVYYKDGHAFNSDNLMIIVVYGEVVINP